MDIGDFGLTQPSTNILAAGRTEARTAPHIAAVGVGYWGRNVVRNLAALGALAAVCDSDPSAAQAAGIAHGVAVRAWRQVLDDRAIAAIAIAAPAALHGQLAREAIEAGKDVFVEKPLALNLPEATALCELAAARGRILMVGHLLQYHPAFLKLKEMVAAGELGRLHYVYSNRLNLGKIRREETVLWSFAPHDISMILALVDAEPFSISAEGAGYLNLEVADVTTTCLAFPGGAHAHIFVSWLHPFKEQKLVAIGAQAMAVFDDGNPWPEKLVLYRHGIEWQDQLPVPQRVAGEAIAVPEGEPLLLEMQHFLDCIRTRATPRTDGREGLRVLRVLDAATAALKQTRGRRTAADFPGVQIHETAFIDEGCRIGAGTKIWHFSHVLPRTRIGKNCVLGQNVVAGPDVAIGDNCKIQNNVSVYRGVTLEDGVFCGPSCVFTNVVNPRAEIERKAEFKPTLVKHSATIGANATIICGHMIGAYAFVAAGAVVTRDVPDYALVMGNPARRVGWMSRAGARLGADLVCPIEGTRYHEKGERLVPLEIKDAR